MISNSIDLLLDANQDEYLYNLSGIVMDRDGAMLFLAFLRDIKVSKTEHVKGIDKWIENLEETLEG